MVRQQDESLVAGSQRPSSAEWLVVVRRLLEAQVDVNARDHLEHTPIHVAVRAGHLEATRCLIDAGADPRLLRKGSSTLHQAAVRGDAQMLVLLLAAAKTSELVNCVGRDGWTALGLAARAGNAAMVKALVDAGANRAAVMKNGKTALDLARLNKKDAVARLLES